MVKVYVNSINDRTPLFCLDDTIYIKLNIYTQEIEKQKILVDHLTATWCPNTPILDSIFQATNIDQKNLAIVSTHFNDEYSYKEADAYSILNSGFLPYYEYGRIHQSNGYWNRINAINQPSFANVYLEANFNKNSRKLDIIITGKRTDEYVEMKENPVLTVLLTEDSLISRQRATNYSYIRNYVHNNVLRTNVSAIWGDSISWIGNTYKKEYSTQLNEEWIWERMKIVAFISKPYLGDYKDIEVINCNDLALKDAYIETSINEVDEQMPNNKLLIKDKRILVSGNYDDFRIYSTNGTLINNNSQLSPGIYLVKLRTKEEISSIKVVIK